ncbi:MAG: STAS domain-containing protein [Candidatus Eremiobacteraeota bacterium]|nr:STAS domain-containing protein [Candidatus Eremiobacteraeota bacterium]
MTDMKLRTIPLRRSALAQPETIAIGVSFDVTGARRFARSVTRLAQRHPASVIVDMSQTQSVDSSGFGSLISGLKKLDDAGATSYVVCANPAVRRLMDFTGVSRMFAVVDRLSDARHAIEQATAGALAS